MLPFSFEDRVPDYCPGIGYGTTNEEPSIMRGLVRPFKKGLAIASGGEVTFLNLLPKTRETLVLVDHAYPSLKVFCTKALLLATLGPVATRNLFIAEKRAGWSEAIEKVVDYLPLKIKNATYTLPNDATNIRREWYYADLASLKRAAENLHRIKLIHGNLMDTADRAPYDFLYLSNALEHSGRTGQGRSVAVKHPDVKELSSALLKKGSDILWVQANSSSYGANERAIEAWKVKKRILGYRTTWVYFLSKKES